MEAWLRRRGHGMSRRLPAPTGHGHHQSGPESVCLGAARRWREQRFGASSACRSLALRALITIALDNEGCGFGPPNEPLHHER